MGEDLQEIIKVSHLCKEYGLYESKRDRLLEVLDPRHKPKHRVFRALQDISFQVCRGETVGIIGTNGSGKSTLLKILTKVVSPTSGEVAVGGRISALLELGAGFHPGYTGLQNIYLNGTMMGYGRREMEERIPKIVEFADIGEFISQPVKNYSSGMFARLAFAVAINVEPDILIVDEALSVGDVFFQNKCFRKFEELQSRGVTILFVSHDLESVKQMCGRALWIEQGRQMMFGDSRQVCNAYAGSILQKNNREVTGGNRSVKKGVEGIKGHARAQGTKLATGPATESAKEPVKVFAEERPELPLSCPEIQEYGRESILHPKVAIKAFYFENALGQVVHNLRGGEEYTLVIVFESGMELSDAIVGFVLQNKKGQILVNSNTLLSQGGKPFKVKAGSRNRVAFQMNLPYFATNEYLLDCAVARGSTVLDSEMLTWLYGALKVYIENPLGNLGMLDVETEVVILEGDLHEQI